MANPSVKARDLISALTSHKCTQRAGKGSHSVWYCNCPEKHMVTTTLGHGKVAPATLRDFAKHMPCISLSF